MTSPVVFNLNVNVTALSAVLVGGDLTGFPVTHLILLHQVCKRGSPNIFSRNRIFEKCWSLLFTKELHL